MHFLITFQKIYLILILKCIQNYMNIILFDTVSLIYYSITLINDKECVENVFYWRILRNGMYTCQLD